MTTTESTDSRNVALRVLHWLETGYPDGIPRQDRFPLIALLRRRLTDEQTKEIVADLTAPGALETRGDDPITSEEITELIARQLRESPSADDVSRVSARLAAAGWPLADSLE
jgi:phenylpyruvate tautomerase PptA (4-oxalocrotonate tautomerase family)